MPNGFLPVTINYEQRTILVSRDLGEGGNNQPTLNNYAKQTQFTERSNKRKLVYNKGLRKHPSPRTLQKQSQSNPISNFLLGISYGENFVC